MMGANQKFKAESQIFSLSIAYSLGISVEQMLSMISDASVDKKESLCFFICYGLIFYSIVPEVIKGSAAIFAGSTGYCWLSCWILWMAILIKYLVQNTLTLLQYDGVKDGFLAHCDLGTDQLVWKISEHNGIKIGAFMK